MTSEIATGKIPWYGVFGNDVKSIHNTIEKNDENNNEVDRDFRYIPEWTVQLGGDDLNIIIYQDQIDFYTSVKSNMFKYKSPSFTDNNENEINSTSTVYETRVFSLDLCVAFNYNYDFPNKNIYIKDTGELLFIRAECSDGISELIITNDGYIQYRTNDNSGNRIRKLDYFVKDLLNDGDTCKNCFYNDACPYYEDNPSSTTCEFDITEIDYNYSYFSSNYYSQCLLIPSEDEYNYTAVTDKYITNTGLNSSDGEIYIKSEKSNYTDERFDLTDEEIEFIRVIPLHDSYSTDSNILSIGTKINNDNKYIYLKNTNNISTDDESCKDGILNVKYNDKTYLNTYSRTKSQNIESLAKDTKYGMTMNYVYTEGTTTASTYFRWYDNFAMQFNNRINVEKITFAFKVNAQSYDSKDFLPNSTCPTIRFYYTTSSSNKTTIHNSSSNVKYFDVTLSSPYTGTYFVTKEINGYIKQLTWAPLVTYSDAQDIVGSSNIDDKLTYSIDVLTITITHANTSTDSYTYSK